MRAPRTGRSVLGKRSRSIGLTRLRAFRDVMLPPTEEKRPQTREDCRDAPRPCPWVGCRFHLYLDVTPAGSLKLVFPDLEPWELKHTCALDVAESGGMTLEEVGVITNLTRERVRQLEVLGLLKIKQSGEVG